MNPYRSMLFVPGNRPSWVDKAIASGTDAVILDLEDSVPPAEKDDARAAMRAAVQRLAAGAATPGVWVRPNAWESRLAGADLEAVVIGGLDGVLLPKVYGPEDVLRFDALLEHFEIRAGLEAGSVEIIVSLETAESMAVCEQIARASPRIASLFGATARDADIGRALGITWTAEGLETLYLRSRILLACRSGGLQHPICGLWQDLRDLEGLERFATANRGLGYRGQVAIHPSHIAVINRVFTPSSEELAFYRRMVAAFEAAQAAGRAAVDYEGQHIDIAHAKTAREILARAEALRPA
jgi:citrate lyase subunit beta / citryl-CoA lyase